MSQKVDVQIFEAKHVLENESLKLEHLNRYLEQSLALIQHEIDSFSGKQENSMYQLGDARRRTEACLLRSRDLARNWKA